MEEGDVTKERRQEQILEFLQEHDIPLPPLAIYYGLYRHYHATYSYRTVQNDLKELTDNGAIVRVDTSALREGEMKEIPSEKDARRRTYYFITDKGEADLRNEDARE